MEIIKELEVPEEYSSNLIAHEILVEIRKLIGPKKLIFLGNTFYSISSFLKEKNISYKIIPDMETCFTTFTSPTSIKSVLNTGHIQFEWKNKVIDLIYTAYNSFCYNYCIADSQDTVIDFELELYKYTHKVTNSIFRYNVGAWYEDKDLKEGFKQSWDDLIIEESLKKEIKDTLTSFFNKGSYYYDLLDIPYKSGAIMVGNPGCGKTTCIKLLATDKDINVNILQVKSFSGGSSTREGNIECVFDTARDKAPAILIFEDLDSLITEDVKSVFLNKLDGLSKCNGLYVIATTNYPERIDPALLSRPSRFDRKWIFKDPDETLRKKYLTHLITKVFNKMNKDITEELDITVNEVVKRTNKFTYAFLQEIIITSLQLWNKEDFNNDYSISLNKACDIMLNQKDSSEATKILNTLNNRSKVKVGF